MKEAGKFNSDKRMEPLPPADCVLAKARTALETGGGVVSLEDLGIAAEGAINWEFGQDSTGERVGRIICGRCRDVCPFNVDQEGNFSSLPTEKEGFLIDHPIPISVCLAG